MNRTEKRRQKTLYDLKRLFSNEPAEIKKVNMARRASLWVSGILIIIAMMLVIHRGSDPTGWAVVIMSFAGGILFNVASMYQNMFETWPLLRELIDREKLGEMASKVEGE